MVIKGERLFPFSLSQKWKPKRNKQERACGKWDGDTNWKSLRLNVCGKGGGDKLNEAYKQLATKINTR